MKVFERRLMHKWSIHWCVRLPALSTPFPWISFFQPWIFSCLFISISDTNMPIVQVVHLFSEMKKAMPSVMEVKYSATEKVEATSPMTGGLTRDKLQEHDQVYFLFQLRSYLPFPLGSSRDTSLILQELHVSTNFWAHIWSFLSETSDWEWR